jgi:hypothetical protein
MKLGELLVAKGLLSREQLLAALQAQSQFGGRLGTNLVEMGFVNEEQVARVLSEQLKLPCVSAEMVASIPAEVIARVSPVVAKDYGVVPFQLEGRTLHVCMSDPANLQKVDELAFRLSARLKPFVATELVLNYALERYYGVRRQTRFLTLSGAAVPAASFIQLSDPHAPGAATGAVDRGEFLRPESADGAGLEADARAAPARLPDVSAQLVDVRSSDEVVTALARFFGAMFPHTVLLTAREGMVSPLHATGTSIASGIYRRIQLPLVEDSLFADAIREVRIIHRERVTDATVAALCQSLSLEPRHVTVIPVLENRRVVLLLVGQGIEQARVKELFAAVRRVLGQASCALQILTLRQQILNA